MGEPMALDLMKAGTPLLVSNRSPSKSAILAEAGVVVAKDPAEVFARCDVVISNVLENVRLIAEAAREAGISSPLLDACHALYRETRALDSGTPIWLRWSAGSSREQRPSYDGLRPAKEAA